MNVCASAYIHIPFCKTICTYCDFCKLNYHQLWVSNYLVILEKEIFNFYKGELLSTIYIGGGTPNSLSDEEFEKLLQIVSKLKVKDNYEYTIECNVELLTEKQVFMMKKYGVNRVSLGVQTFQNKFLKFLNRNHTKDMVIDKVRLLKSYGITNINVDLMYAFLDETLEDLQYDIECVLSLDVPHISTYSLMIEPHTMLYYKNTLPIEEELDLEMYKLICNKLAIYKHYETSNFAISGYESKHNLTYWNNERYYGFGLGASGYIDNIRYTNTKNLTSYLNGNYRIEENILTDIESMENEMILGLRKIDGVSVSNFFKKYGKNIEDIFEISDLLKNGMLLKDKDYIKISDEYIYTSNDILINFIGCDRCE